MLTASAVLHGPHEVRAHDRAVPRPPAGQGECDQLMATVRTPATGSPLPSMAR